MLAEIVECTANCYLMSAPDAHQTRSASPSYSQTGVLLIFSSRGTAFCGEVFTDSLSVDSGPVLSSGDANSNPE